MSTLFEHVKENYTPAFDKGFCLVKVNEDDSLVIAGIENTVTVKFNDEGHPVCVDIANDVDVAALDVVAQTAEERLDNLAKIAVSTGMSALQIAWFIATINCDDEGNVTMDDVEDHSETIEDIIKGYDVDGSWAKHQMMHQLMDM